MVKKGDTLIEVTLAIGIFSMVAISVVAVMTSGTASSQTALETTLAREEIDIQAEALRFIHSAYLADVETGETKDPYNRLWQEIIANAYVLTSGENESNKLIQQYNPTTCNEIYNDEIQRHAFIINPRKLASIDTDDYQGTRDNYKDVLRTYSKYPELFRATNAYPRVIYEESQLDKQEDALVDNSKNDEIKRVEGLYVVAVADPNSTVISGSTSRKSAYYDFYIRTCWYGTGSETPTAISTNIRLYNPAGIVP